jgi:RecA-family ATPase
MINYNPIQKQNKSISNPENENISILLIRTANQCIEDAKLRPIPKMLFSEFWHEGEICILFADTNLGKSILAVMIAISISSGVPIKCFKMEATKQKVIYLDFEMSDKQFEKRYSQNYTNHYQFDDNFFRVNINPNCINFDDFERQLFINIESIITENDVKVIIVDNLTYLKTQSTDTSKEALPLMKKLKELTIKYGLSILALAHTPKRNCFNPITINDLAGSKQLANFADSIFSIGSSSIDKSVRYIKQLKARATEIIYDTENVISCEVIQTTNFLKFEFMDFGNEQQHLKVLDANESDELNNTILETLIANPNLSQYEIAKQLNTNKMRVKRVYDKNFILPL